MSDQIDISRKALEAVMMSLPAGPWMARGRVHSQSMRVWGTTNPTHTNHGVSPDDFIIADISRGAQCAATASFIAQSREMILALRAALDAAEADKAAAVDATLDAAHEYLVSVYGHSPLSHPIDRARINAIRTVAKP